MLLWMVIACLADASEPTMATAPEGFWEHWGDGRAELSGYTLAQPRYGQQRSGEVVLVYVTETFTHGQRVKSDGGHDDEYPVIKLNDSREYQTGVYDYDVMTSTFVRLDGHAPVGLPVKVSMSMAEWCGHVYEQLIPGDGALRWTSHSYFDGEGDRDRDLTLPVDGVMADAMPILVRGLAGTWLAPGDRRTVPWLPALTHGRYAHTAPAWTTATLSRDASPSKVEVPVGTFEADIFRSEAPEGTTTWWVEVAPPHRLLKWASTTGEEGLLTGTARLPYWTLNREGDERVRATIGLPVAPPR